MAHDVFISYSHGDKPAADAACAMLEGAGIRCWMAPRDVAPGSEWGAAIIEAIDGARVMVLIFSSKANASSQVSREVQRAANREVIIVPLRIEPAEPSGSLAYLMSGVHWLDALTPPLETYLQGLVTTIRAILQAPHNVTNLDSDIEKGGLKKSIGTIDVQIIKPRSLITISALTCKFLVDNKIFATIDNGNDSIYFAGEAGEQTISAILGICGKVYLGIIIVDNKQQIAKEIKNICITPLIILLHLTAVKWNLWLGALDYRKKLIQDITHIPHRFGGRAYEAFARSASIPAIQPFLSGGNVPAASEPLGDESERLCQVCLRVAASGPEPFKTDHEIGLPLDVAGVLYSQRLQSRQAFAIGGEGAGPSWAKIGFSRNRLSENPRLGGLQRNETLWRCFGCTRRPKVGLARTATFKV